MGLVVGKIQRRLRRFNIDNRAHAVISKDKPTPAPKTPAAIKQLNLAMKISPNFLENHYKKDSKLDDYLKNIYVTSTDPEVVTSHTSSDRPLPQSRSPGDFEFGFYMPDTVMTGKCTLKHIFDIINLHTEDSVKFNVNALATEYKLDKEVVEKLLNYYKLYQLIEPKINEDNEKSQLQIIKEQLRRQLMGDKIDKTDKTDKIDSK